MTDKKMWKEMRAKLEAAGCQLIPRKDGAHLKVYLDGELITVMQNSPSSWRSHKNKRAELRRKGIAI